MLAGTPGSTFLRADSGCFQLRALPCRHADWQWADEMPSWGDDPATKDAVRSDHEVRTVLICRACVESGAWVSLSEVSCHKLCFQSQKLDQALSPVAQSLHFAPVSAADM